MSNRQLDYYSLWKGLLLSVPCGFFFFAIATRLIIAPPFSEVEITKEMQNLFLWQAIKYGLPIGLISAYFSARNTPKHFPASSSLVSFDSVADSPIHPDKTPEFFFIFRAVIAPWFYSLVVSGIANHQYLSALSISNILLAILGYFFAAVLILPLIYFLGKRILSD